MRSVNRFAYLIAYLLTYLPPSNFVTEHTSSRCGLLSALHPNTVLHRGEVLLVQVSMTYGTCLYGIDLVSMQLIAVHLTRLRDVTRDSAT